MSIEANKVIVRRLFAEINKANLAVLDELCAANYVYHSTHVEDVHSPEGMKQHMSTVWTVFPDFHVAVEDVVAEGDKVAVRLTFTSTRQGEEKEIGTARTGKQITWTAISIMTIVGGKIVEEWEESDMLGMMQQLGAISMPGQ